MTGQPIYLVLDAGACEAVFASADELARDRALEHLRAAVAGRVWLEDSIALFDFDAFSAKDFPITPIVNGVPQAPLHRADLDAQGRWAHFGTPGTSVRSADADWPGKAKGGSFAAFVGVCGAPPAPPVPPPAPPVMPPVVQPPSPPNNIVIPPPQVEPHPVKRAKPRPKDCAWLRSVKAGRKHLIDAGCVKKKTKKRLDCGDIPKGAGRAWFDGSRLGFKCPLPPRLRPHKPLLPPVAG